MDAFCNAITSVGKDVVAREELTKLEWFKASKNDLIPLINERNKTLLVTRFSNDLSLKIKLKLKCIDTRNNVKDTIKVAKSNWIATLAERIENINNTLKDV